MTTKTNRTIEINEEYYRDGDDTTIRFVMDDSIATYRIEERQDEYDADGNLINEDDWNTCYLVDSDIKNILGCRFYAVKGKLTCVMHSADAEIRINDRFLCTISTCIDDIALYDEATDDEALEYVTDEINYATGNYNWVLDIENDLSALIGLIDARITAYRENKED